MMARCWTALGVNTLTLVVDTIVVGDVGTVVGATVAVVVDEACGGGNVSTLRGIVTVVVVVVPTAVATAACGPTRMAVTQATAT
jgi:hypothetical protein